MSTRGARRARPRPGRRLEQGTKRVLLPLACRLFAPRRAGPGIRLADARRVLLVRQDNRLGNLVLLSPFLQALRQAAPAARIAFLAGDRYSDILAGSPWIDDLIVERKRWLIRHLYAYPPYVRALRRGRWDIAVELSNPDTHSFYNALLTVMSGAPLRVGFAHSRSRDALNRAVPPPQRECHYSLAPLLLLSALGVNPPIAPMRLSPALHAFALRSATDAGRPLVIHPGGRGDKRWPAARFRRLVQELAGIFPGRILLIGGPRDAALLENLQEAGRGRADSRVLHDVAALISLLGSARMYVGCDTGPMHVAAALGLPTLALFLTSHPLRYAPLGEPHETLLLGERSRAFARQEDFPAAEQPPPADAAAWDPAFLARIAAQRPRLMPAPEGLDEAEEVRLVMARAELMLARAGAAAEAPAAGPGILEAPSAVAQASDLLRQE